MKYIAIVDDDFISNFRVDIKSNAQFCSDIVLVVTDKAGSTRGIGLKPLQSAEEQESIIKNPFFTVSGVNELAKYSIETIGHSDPYLQGMCNGIEYMRACLTDTEPHFITEVESEG